MWRLNINDAFKGETKTLTEPLRLGKEEDHKQSKWLSELTFSQSLGFSPSDS